MKIKVLFTIDSLRLGGAETSILALLDYLSNDLDITVCYFYEPHDLRDKFLKAPCKLKYFKLFGKYSFFKGIFLLNQFVVKEKFQIIISSLYRASIISRVVSFISGIPVIDTIVNDSYGIEKKREFKGLNIYKLYLVYILDFLTSHIPKMWISNSRIIANELSKKLKISSQKIEVLYRGRNINILKEWRLPNSDRFIFICYGRLYPQKAQLDLINAFSRIYDKYSKVSLVIYGEGPMRVELEKRIFELNLCEVVQLPGRVDNAWEKLYDAHCFVLPSKYEGFSGALVEALISGIPVICSDIPMNCEAVRNGENGLLYRSNNLEELELAMENVFIYYKEAVNRGKCAREEALIKYDLSKIASKYESLIVEIFSKHCKA